MRYNTEEMLRTTTFEFDECIAEAADRLRSLDTRQLAVTSSDKVVGTISAEGILRCVAENHVAWQCEVFRHMEIRY